MRVPLLWAFLAVATALACVAQAQECISPSPLTSATPSASPEAVPSNSPASGKPADLGEIRVSDEIPKGSSAEDSSAFVSVIDPKTYAGEFRSTSELLERTVGVHVIDYGGIGQRQVVSIRGSTPEQVVVLLDGVRLNSAQKGGVDIASIPVEIIEKIEVLRGGEAALYGTDAVGGVVNIITKKGTDQTKDGKPLTSAIGSYGSFNTIKAAASNGWKVGPFDYFVSYTHLSSDGDFPFLDTNYREQVRINNKSISEAPFGRFGWEITPLSRLELTEQFYWANRGEPGFGEFQLPAANSDEKRNFLNLRFDQKQFMVDNLNLKVNTFYRYEKYKFFDPHPQIGPAVNSDTRDDAAGGEAKVEYLLPPFQVFSATFEAREDFANVFSNSAAANRQQNFEVKRFTYAGVLKDELRFFDERLSLLPTVRWEDSDKTKGEIVPKFGVRGKLLDWLVLKTNIGRVFRIPNFDELYFPESEFIGGNPNLIPENGYTADAGFEAHTKPFFFSASAFYTKMHNAIFFVPISATRIMPLNFQDNTISQGFEVDGQWDPIQYFSLNATYTFLDAFFESTGFNLPGRSNNTATFRGVVKYPPWVQVYLEGKYQSEFSVVLASAGGQLESERFVMNTGCSVKPVDFLTVSIDVKDVNDARRINDSRDFPLPERAYYGTIAVTF